MRLVLALAVLAAPAALPAQGVASRYEPSDDYFRCMASGDASLGNATAISMCRGLERMVQGQRLDEAYGRAFNAVIGWDQVRLYNEQADWRDGLNPRCASIPAQGMDAAEFGRVFDDCRTQEIAARADYLESLTAE